jgi:hypothetical protein
MVPPDLIHALRLGLISCVLGGGMPLQAQEEGSAPADVETGQKITFRLDGDRTLVRGTLESWDSSGLTGSFGTHPWERLDLASLRRIMLRLLDREAPEDWVLLGELQLRRDEAAADHYAELAFKRARQLDPDSDRLVDAARKRVEEFKKLAAEAERLRAAQRLNQGMPEGVAWVAAPWPVLTDAEQADALAELRVEARTILEDAGLPETEPIETNYFLVYMVDSPASPKGVVRDLDQMYLKIASLLDLPETDGRPINLFWGKAVVIISGEEDQFRLIEAQAFRQMTAPGVVGLCHCLGPRVFVNTFRSPDDYRFASVLVHEAVHGMMHRYVTPRRLPTWANEGFADWVADDIVPGGTTDRQRRRQGLDFIRGNGRLPEVMNMSYEDGTWPGPAAVGYAASYLLVHQMIDQNRLGFADWVRAVKMGRDWREAMVEQYGASAERLAAHVREWHLVND